MMKLEVAFLWVYLCKGEWADSVDVSCQHDSVLLRGIREGSVCGEQVLSYEKDYWCSEDGIEVRKTETVVDRPAVAKDWIAKTRTFRKAVDGSLVLKDSSSGKGVSAYMIVPVPYAYGESTWYRFEAIAGAMQAR